VWSRARRQALGSSLDSVEGDIGRCVVRNDRMIIMSCCCRHCLSLDSVVLLLASRPADDRDDKDTAGLDDPDYMQVTRICKGSRCHYLSIYTRTTCRSPHAAPQIARGPDPSRK
jgi:hypothetical protein